MLLAHGWDLGAGMLKMLSKFPIIEGESAEAVEERVDAQGGSPGLYYSVTDEENSRTL